MYLSIIRTFQILYCKINHWFLPFWIPSQYYYSKIVSLIFTICLQSVYWQSRQSRGNFRGKSRAKDKYLILWVHLHMYLFDCQENHSEFLKTSRPVVKQRWLWTQLNCRYIQDTFSEKSRGTCVMKQAYDELANVFMDSLNKGLNEMFSGLYIHLYIWLDKNPK